MGVALLLRHHLEPPHVLHDTRIARQLIETIGSMNRFPISEPGKHPTPGYLAQMNSFQAEPPQNLKRKPKRKIEIALT
jgi:hypothetical protein